MIADILAYCAERVKFMRGNDFMIILRKTLLDVMLHKILLEYC